MRKLKLYIIASRPATMVASIIPISVGNVWAYYEGYFDGIVYGVTLICAMLIQLGTNYANDYYDYVKGVDTSERKGPIRMSSLNDSYAKKMRNASYTVMSMAFFIGLYLIIWHGGMVVLVVGVLSIFFGLIYTAGPYPIGYYGLGELFVFVFFGLVAVGISYYIQVQSMSNMVILSGCGIGAMCTNLMVVNNIRDIEEDRKAKKYTLGVLMGRRFMYVLYFFMLVIAWFVLWYLYITLQAGLILISIVGIFIGILNLIFMIYIKERVYYNTALKISVLSFFVYGGCLCLTILWLGR